MFLRFFSHQTGELNYEVGNFVFLLKPAKLISLLEIFTSLLRIQVGKSFYSTAIIAKF